MKWLKYHFRYTPILALEPKIDGIALSIVYDERGRFQSATTKHRGQNEDYDVTEKIKVAGCVPPYGPEGEQITGEFVLIGESWPKEYKTRRGVACAYLQSKSNELAKERFAFSLTAWAVLMNTTWRKKRDFVSCTDSKNSTTAARLRKILNALLRHLKLCGHSGPSWQMGS